MKHKRYWVYPYMISLLKFSSVFFPVVSLIAYLSTKHWLLFILPFSMLPFIFFIEWLEGYKMLGWVTLDENTISLHAPFRKTLTLCWTDIRHAGFGSSSTDALTFDWIYLRSELLPLQYQHRMHRLPCTPSSIRFQYQDDLFQAILPHLSKQTRTMLEAGKRHMEEQQSRHPKTSN